MSYVRPLAEVAAEETRMVGGKAANLAKLVRAGLPVPKGLAVGLSSFDAGKLTEVAKQQIEQYLEQTKLYAVRSSALAEDAEGASWAGQFETYLNTKPDDVTAKIELCHNTAKNRAKAYANNKDTAASENFNIAVVVQEMLKPEYAGVLFTKDPVTGENTFVTEYVSGLGEELVSGRADPTRIVVNPHKQVEAPFDTRRLAELAVKVELLFGVPQDIEWVWADDTIWLVQARPITATQESRSGYYLGEPHDLFYWGPSRAKPVYMSDFMAAAERLYVNMANDPNLPNPPKTVVLFDEGKMVWLNNAQEFADFTEQTFAAYEKLNRLDQDVDAWKVAAERLPLLSGPELTDALVDAWYCTEFAEFSLYGAETALIKRLSRFDAHTRQEIWGAFTVPERPSFLARIDSELVASQDPDAISQKYPWILDGYEGISTGARQYFVERLINIGSDAHERTDPEPKRSELVMRVGLTEGEISALTLARKLAEFMDDRKAWMMQTRRLITGSVDDVANGWFYDSGTSKKINQTDAHELWQRYVDFKTSTNAVVGVVASSGGKHFVNGEVVVVNNPTDVVEEGKIIVVPSTSPSYVPLMRKAKALVTDHGGMMSHAAIVAREFNLPCIVGTKQGTKILKSGDKVVLDLVRGEVNK